jgi:excisionase family DNA binding protein
MKRRTHITIETDRVLVIRRHGRLVMDWCAECSEQVKMITPHEAAAVTGISTRTIYRWIEADSIHFTETHEGSMLVCLNSLSRLIPEVAKHSIT